MITLGVFDYRDDFTDEEIRAPRGPGTYLWSLSWQRVVLVSSGCPTVGCAHWPLSVHQEFIFLSKSLQPSKPLNKTIQISAVGITGTVTCGHL